MCKNKNVTFEYFFKAISELNYCYEIYDHSHEQIVCLCKLVTEYESYTSPLSLLLLRFRY